MFSNFFKKRKTILGMNERNLSYINQYNKRGGFRLADHKLKTKKKLNKFNIPNPKIFATISNEDELKKFNWDSLPESFVIKPNNGVAGKGIVVIFSKDKKNNDLWIKSNGNKISKEELKNHISDILAGFFSLNGAADLVFFEERVKITKELKPYSFRGIPDIRVIVFNQVPIMAMLRLPTKKSDGKANLLQGGLGVGIDMSNGITTTAIYGKDTVITRAPDSKLLLSGIQISHWDEILEMAVSCQKVSKLGYLGVDIVIDREKGPMILELNARPGLSIQIANQSGLKERLERVKNLDIKTAQRGMLIGKSLFGGEIDKQIQNTSGKPILGRTEIISLEKNDFKIENEKAKIDTGAFSTSVDESIAKKLGFTELLDKFKKIDLTKYEKISRENDEKIVKQIFQDYKDKINNLENVTVVWSSNGVSIRPVVSLKLKIAKKTLNIKANITKRDNLKYKVLIGRKDLTRFLIDVTKTNN